RRNERAGDRADPVDPPSRPRVAGELGPECASRVHRRPGYRTADEDVDRDREADREARNRLERAARVHGGGPDRPDEEEGHDRFERESLPVGDVRRGSSENRDRDLPEEPPQDEGGGDGAQELRG